MFYSHYGCRYKIIEIEIKQIKADYNQNICHAGRCNGGSYSEMGEGVRVGVRGGKRQEEEVLLIHLILCLYSPLSSSCNLNWTVRNEKESVFWHLKNFIKKSINHWPKVHKTKEDERSIEETFTLTFRQKQGTSYSFSGGWHS